MIAPADRHELEALKSQGFGDYLVKPLRPASLAARLGGEPTEPSIVPDEAAAFPPVPSRRSRNARSRCWSPRTTRSTRF